MADVALHYGIRKARSVDNDETDINGAAIYLLIPAYILYVLIMLGLLKACIGLTCSTYIGLWGLNHLISLPYPLNNYYERDLAQYRVQYDDDGWPVDPVSQKRTRPMNKSTEFCLNVVFFLAIPFACLRTCIKRNDNGDSCDLYTTCQGEEMDIYCDANDSEAEDTKYILAQMDRSEQSLRVMILTHLITRVISTVKDNGSNTKSYKTVY